MNEINPFFPVLRNQLFTPFCAPEDDYPVDVYVNRDALLNGDTGNVLGTVAPKYKIITNQEVSDIFAEAFSHLPIERTVDHMNHRENRWQRDLILNGDAFNIDIDGDIIKTKVSIFNGYDGKTAVGFTVAAYRERGDVTYLNNMFTETYTHVQHGLVTRIREDFANKIQMFSDTVSLLRVMNRGSFTGADFEAFIRTRIREENEDGFLAPRQAQAIIDSYEVYITRCGVRRTRFGAYTVLSSFAAHDLNGRGGSSPIFTQGHKRMERLVQDFFEYDQDDMFTISVD